MCNCGLFCVDECKNERSCGKRRCNPKRRVDLACTAIRVRVRVKIRVVVVVI